MKAQEKTPIAVVFYVNQKEDIEGTGYCSLSERYRACAYSDSIGIKHDTSADLAAFDGNSNTHAMYSILRLQPKLFLTCGNMDRHFTSLPLLSYTCCIVRNKINEYIRKCGGDEGYRTILMNAGTGHQQK